MYTATARFICPDFQCRPRDDREVIELSVCEQLHLDIFQSLIVIYNRAIMTPSKSYLSKQEKKKTGRTLFAARFTPVVKEMAHSGVH